MKIERFDPLIEVSPDGLHTPEVRIWSLEKYRLMGSYCDIFTSGMKNKWDQLVYIDLFAGAGHSFIQETKKVYRSSAMIALSVPTPFTKYIFCEQDDQRLEALRARVKRDFPDRPVAFIKGDSNSKVDDILEAIPKFGKSNTLLSFCFVDPYSLNLKFATIQALGKNLMDFLILQALHMDAKRNFENYLNEESNKIADYLGISNWRELFALNESRNKSDFVKFLADQYLEQMKKLRYVESKEMHQIRSNEKNLPLYYLTFYTKHRTGNDFFKKIKRSSNSQLSLDM